ncbi:hypothetical protein L3Y34_016474 [Caenorhabditis briggsae]|uniref:Uncharacterized protein n=1 Tax=Caenorhabditis briggsae TaxID=6238 RepID=A0AAE9J172_CAEBR|nr:hypothetical protein L3Y34_016474 [Caenorhabditis briggsae]
MIKILFELMCSSIQNGSLLIVFFYPLIIVPILFMICVKKKVKKCSKKPSSPESQASNVQQQPLSLVSPSGAPPPGITVVPVNVNKVQWKGRQKPMVVFDDEQSRSNAKTPKAKSVDEQSEKIRRSSQRTVTQTASSSQKFDSSTSVHEKATVAQAPPPTVTPKDALEPPKDENSVEDQQRSEETENND